MVKDTANFPATWEAPPKARTPKLADLVVLEAWEGTFVVSAIDTPRTTVDLRQIGRPDVMLHRIPWAVLVYLEEEAKEK